MGILLMCPSTKLDARPIHHGRVLRGVVHGPVSVGPFTYLGALGFGAFEIGVREDHLRNDLVRALRDMDPGPAAIGRPIGSR